MSSALKIAPQAAPLGIDVTSFARDIDALRAELDASLGPEDYAHLAKHLRWGRGLAWFGYATAWIAPNPISAIAIALANTSRWAIAMHHIAHRGYDRVPGTPPRLTSRRFAFGWRRAIDWLDWMAPEAWRFEHNALHHGHTGESGEDPDLVEDYAAWLRVSRMPLALKYFVIVFFASFWKINYYAPSTFLVWRHAEKRRRGDVSVGTTITSHLGAFDLRTADGRAFWWSCLLPYGLFRFALLPLLFAPLGAWAVFSVLANSLVAEAIANLHSLAIIVPNHAGDDLYRFEGRAGDRGTYYLRQVIGSTDYTSGGDLADFLQGGLNYQIEHHLFPDLPLSACRKSAPRVEAICAKHGVPYVKESVFARVKKLFDIFTGKTSMLRMPER